MAKKRGHKAKQTVQKTRAQKVSEAYGPATQLFMKKKQSGFCLSLTRKEIEEDLSSIFAQVPRQKRVVNSKYLSPREAPSPPPNRLRVATRGPKRNGNEAKSPRNTSSDDVAEDPAKRAPPVAPSAT